MIVPPIQLRWFLPPLSFIINLYIHIRYRLVEKAHIVSHLFSFDIISALKSSCHFTGELYVKVKGQYIHQCTRTIPALYLSLCYLFTHLHCLLKFTPLDAFTHFFLKMTLSTVESLTNYTNQIIHHTLHLLSILSRVHPFQLRVGLHEAPDFVPLCFSLLFFNLPLSLPLPLTFLPFSLPPPLLLPSHPR